MGHKGSKFLSNTNGIENGIAKEKASTTKKYDYSQNGCYFVTVCVKNKEPLLGVIHDWQDVCVPPDVELTQAGTIADQYVQNINTVYGHVTVDKYVIMPNHIHMIIVINKFSTDNGGLRAARPTLHTIIRDEKAYCEVWEYIDDNLLKWKEDELYDG